MVWVLCLFVCCGGVWGVCVWAGWGFAVWRRAERSPPTLRMVPSYALAMGSMPCESSHVLSSSAFQPPGKRLPDFFACPDGARRWSGTTEQCIYPTGDGVTWARTRSTDSLVRRENLNEYPPLGRALRGIGNINTVVDAGASDGLSTRLFAQALPEARVIALEPVLSNYAMLLRNTRDLGPRVTALRAALGNSSSTMAVHGALPSISVTGLLAALCAPTVDFLKMDIEGAEMSVLALGASSWLSRVRNSTPGTPSPFFVPHCPSLYSPW